MAHIELNKTRPSNRPKKKGKKRLICGVGIFVVLLAAMSSLDGDAVPDEEEPTDRAVAPVIDTVEGDEDSSREQLEEVLELLYSGNGEFRYEEGGIYNGDLVDSMRSGIGTFVWPEGDCFTGEWEEDEMSNGVYQFANGRRYEGTFVKNRFDTGIFDLGECCEENGFVSFQADFFGGKVASLHFQSSSGMIYEGDLTGTAEITYATQNQYSGAVLNGVREGQGEFKWMDGSGASYTGAWNRGIMQGPGKYYFSDKSYPYSEGTFVNGRPDGTATYYKEAGNTFTTTWSDGICTKVTED